MQRRNFIQATSLATLGTLALPHELLQLKKVKKIGIQLYTLRDLMSKDAAGTLEQVAKIGYNHVELASYTDGKVYGKTPAEFKKMLTDVGLVAHSSHIGLDILRQGWEKAVADALVLGQKYVVCPYLMEHERKSMDQYKKLFELLNKCGEVAKKAGLQLAYHNHDFEFQTLDGQVPMDEMLKACDKDLVKIELDLYWAVRAGKDPVAYFQKDPGRFHLWHVKDMANTPEKEFAAVGSGAIDFKKIFQNAKLAGAKYFIVEQDQHKNNQPLVNIENSYKYLKELRY